MRASKEPRMPATYAEAGVSIARGDEVVRRIRPWANQTARPEVVGTIGHFAGGFQLDGTELLAGADGVGSKLLLAKEMSSYDTIGIDLVAMNVNDIAAAGGEPLFFLDYIAMGQLIPERVEQLVRGMAQGCLACGAALLGGETAELPDLYGEGDFDLSGFAVGRRVHHAERPPEPGDVLLGLASSGFHSNGYQLIRAIAAAAQRRWDEPVAELGNRLLGEVLLTPTKIYAQLVMELWQQVPLLAMAHITGGGLMENIPRTLNGLGVEIRANSWPRLPEMRLLQQWGGIADQEMYRTFNCGIGFTLVVAEANVAPTLSFLAKQDVAAYVLGRVTEAPGVAFV